MDTTNIECENMREMQEPLLGQQAPTKEGKTKDEIKKQKARERSRKYHQRHAEKRREYARRYGAAHAEKRNAYNRQYRTRPGAAEQWREYNRRSYRKFVEKRRKESNARSKIRIQKNRLEIFEAYGKMCQCCRETQVEFLSIDHINNGRGNPAKRFGTGDKLYRWLKKNNFPKDNYQILCLQCNQAKNYYGSCPHTKINTPIDSFLGRPSMVPEVT